MLERVSVSNAALQGMSYVMTVLKSACFAEDAFFGALQSLIYHAICDGLLFDRTDFQLIRSVSAVLAVPGLTLDSSCEYLLLAATRPCSSPDCLPLPLLGHCATATGGACRSDLL